MRFKYIISKNRVLKFKQMFLCFIFYSVLGWVYEVFLEVFVYKWGFSNRGVLFGPYCPVYGFGAIIIIKLFGEKIKGKCGIKNYIKDSIYVFLACGAIATLIELAASYMLEFFTGSWPWQTYVDYAINFEGRIALSTSIRFGIGAVIIIAFIEPVFDRIIKSMPHKIFNLLFYIIFTAFSVDLIVLAYTYFKNFC